MNITILIETIVSMLLCINIAYCISLSRKIKDIKKQNGQLHMAVKQINIATDKAKDAIHNIRNNTENNSLYNHKNNDFLPEFIKIIKNNHNLNQFPKQQKLYRK